MQTVKKSDTEEINLKRYLELEKLMGELFKKVDFCKPNCWTQKVSLYPYKPKGSTGCCTYNSWDEELGKRSNRPTQNPIFLLHQERIKIYGEPDYDETLAKCSYHTRKGCKLKTHKPPVCVGYICDDFAKYLKKELGIDTSRDYLENRLTYALRGELSENKFYSFVREVKQWILFAEVRDEDDSNN